MCKPTYTVREYIEKLEITRHLRSAVVTFMLFSVVATATAGSINYYSEKESAPVVETVVAGQNATLNKVITAASTAEMASAAFSQLTARVPEAVEMESVADFISEGIGDIDAERIVMDCDRGGKVLNVSYRLPGGIMLSVNKPLSTMDDEFVMFNVYHQRELLVSDTASIGLLSQYVKNVEKRIAEQA